MSLKERIIIKENLFQGCVSYEGRIVARANVKSF